jgi:hypothetical protein
MTNRREVRSAVDENEREHGYSCKAMSMRLEYPWRRRDADVTLSNDEVVELVRQLSEDEHSAMFDMNVLIAENI